MLVLMNLDVVRLDEFSCRFAEIVRDSSARGGKMRSIREDFVWSEGG